MAMTRKTTDLHPHGHEISVPPLTPVELDALKTDIAQHGIQHDLDITPDGRILDGLHRWKIAQDLGIDEVPVKVFDYEGDSLSEKIHILAHAVRRRHLKVGQRAALARKLFQLEQERARKRQEEGRKKRGHRFLQLEAERAALGKAVEKAAQQLNIAPMTLQKTEVVAKKRPDLLKKLEAGEMSVEAAYRQATSAKQQATKPKRPPVAPEYEIAYSFKHLMDATDRIGKRVEDLLMQAIRAGIFTRDQFLDNPLNKREADA